jgi:23S rRNA (guanosine2251-2'-O)-methyltransferase
MPSDALLNLPHQVIVLDMAGESIFELMPIKPYALVVGSEAKGASAAMRARADRVASIPMQGGIESLNAAVAAAIGMYQLNNKVQ